MCFLGGLCIPSLSYLDTRRYLIRLLFFWSLYPHRDYPTSRLWIPLKSFRSAFSVIHVSTRLGLGWSHVITMSGVWDCIVLLSILNRHMGSDRLDVGALLFFSLAHWACIHNESFGSVVTHGLVLLYTPSSSTMHNAR